MDWLVPDILGIVDAAKDSPANLGYFIFDEPQLGVFDQGQFGKELYDKIHERDGYHPVLVNYSSEIPEQAEGRNWMDILATDPYWVPGFPEWGVRGTVNFVSMITARTVAAGALRRQVPWSLPMCDRWSAMTRRGATPEEQFCQTYLAAIHGAKGIMYFVLQSAQGYPPAWEAACVMGRQFRDVLGPACVAPGLRHTITYVRKAGSGQAEPVAHDPINGKFADIPMALLRDPAGGHILMAANSRYYPVACEVTVKGLTAKTIGRHFAATEYSVKDESFTDPYEAYGVRAYRLPALPEPVEITVTSTPPEKIPEPEKAVAWRDDRKNRMPNPSLEECSVPGWPDYCFGYGKGVWETQRFVDDKVFKFGKQSVRIDGGFIQAHCAAPERSDAAGKYVFSIWLKGSQEGLVELKDLGMHVFYKNVAVTTEWQRYEFPFVMARPGRLIVTVIGMRGSLWVDGLQLERGEKATEFEE
jgi:hypothetical protein